MKTLSVIVPAYNVEKYVENMVCKTLENISGAVELIIVDDGSTDLTLTVAQQMARRFPSSVRVISQKNGGHGSAVNTGINAATGRFVKVVDADDWLDAENTKKVLDVLKSVHNVDVIFSPYYTYDEKKGKIKQVPLPISSIKSGKVNTFKQAKVAETPSMHGFMYNTHFIQRSGVKFDEHVYYDDAEYITFPLFYAKTWMSIDIPTYVYRVNMTGQSTSLANMKKNQDMHMLVLRKINERYVSDYSSIPLENKAMIENRISKLVAAQLKIICLNKSSIAKMKYEELMAEIGYEEHVHTSEMNLPIRLLISSHGNAVSLIKVLSVIKSKFVRV